MENIVSRETIRQRGANAFDRGVPIDGHNMNPWAPAVADWREGWMQRQAEVGALRVLAEAMVSEVSPP
jgi:hypothetical protein